MNRLLATAALALASLAAHAQETPVAPNQLTWDSPLIEAPVVMTKVNDMFQGEANMPVDCGIGDPIVMTLTVAVDLPEEGPAIFTVALREPTSDNEGMCEMMARQQVVRLRGELVPNLGQAMLVQIEGMPHMEQSFTFL